MDKKIGFIGLGLMGGNMVRRLSQCGFDILAYELRPEIAEQFTDCVTLADSVAEVAANRDIICTSLPDPKAVNKVYLGDDGIIKNAKPHTITIDFSTIDPQTTKNIHDIGLKSQIGVIDCPVSGGPQNCYEGTLVLIIGGDDEPIAKANEVFEALGATIHRAGPSGAGETVKLVNNAIALSNLVVSAEGFILGVKAGVDPQVLYDILKTSGARNYHLNKRFPNILANNFEPGFKLETAHKDIGLALDMSAKLDMPLSVISAIYEIYNIGMEADRGSEDCASVIKYFEQLAGVEARSAEK